MDRPRTTSVKMQVTGYRAKPMPTTKQLVEALTDLAVDSPVAYQDFASHDSASTIDQLFHKTKWASKVGIEHWYHNLQNLKLAYHLGYVDLLSWGGADWIQDCCDYFRDDRHVACWFRDSASVYISRCFVTLPNMGEYWSRDGYMSMVASIQANITDPRFYHKEMVVCFNGQTESLLNFIKHSQLAH